MDVKIDLKEIGEVLYSGLDIASLTRAIRQLREFDAWPFNEDGDEYVGIKPEVQHNWELVMNAITEIARVLQSIVVNGKSLSNPQKHKIAADLIDRAIRLPFWAEPFDDILIDMIIKFAVAQMNLLNWGAGEGEVLPKMEVKNGALVRCPI